MTRWEREDLSRRAFVKRMGSGLGLLSVSGLPLSLSALEATPAAGGHHSLEDYEAFVRRSYTWDKKVRGTHLVNCTGACPFFVFVKDGVILREEQSRDVPKLDGVPEYNPRGCNKGVCGTDYVYGPTRLKYPLIRVGERGEGKWRRASWDEALTYVAERLVELSKEHGPDSLGIFTPVPAVSPVSFSAGHRFAHLWGAYTYTFFDWYADLPIGEPITLGVQADVAETADWYNARMILLWGSNPTQTRIPDAHFINEARYNGSQIVCIAPEYNASAIHADTWIHPKPGTDAALAMGMAAVIVKEDLYDAAFLKEQTDMPLLVRNDTKRFLRESDLDPEGSDARFYVWDQETNQPVSVKGSWADEPETPASIQPLFFARNTLTFAADTLALGGLDPALEGSFSVTTEAGAISVRPVFEILKDELESNYSPDKVQEITGVRSEVFEQTARGFAATDPAMIISGGGISHWYHGDQSERGMLLLCALTGNMGRNGAGFHHYIGQWKITPLLGMAKLAFPHSPAKHRFVNTTLWTYLHAGFGENHTNGRLAETQNYIEESLRQKWTPMYPRNGQDPKAMIVYRGNWLNQAKGQADVLRNLWPKLDLIVTLNIRMDSQALFSDVVLPSAHWYEKLDLNCTAEHSFVQGTFPAIEPLYESKTDWQIFRLLAEKIQEVAAEKGFTRYFDEEFDWDRDYSTFYNDFTDGGKFELEDACAQFILDTAPQTSGITLDQLREDGPQRFLSNWTSPMDGAPYNPFKHFVQDKKPWPTLVGRMQFYIDHDWFLELNKELPVHHNPLRDEDEPLVFNTPHNRHAIHSTWKDNESLLRLGRGGPYVLMSPADAAERGIDDDDWVEIFNKTGRVICRAKLYASAMPGQVTMPFSPELFMDLIEGGSQSPLPIQINPTQLVGDYGQLQFKPNYYGPIGSQRDVMVEIRKHKV